MSYLMGIFIAVDQLGNALAGGDPDSTISARVGYFANINRKTKDLWYWNTFQWIIDKTFQPHDGKFHCLQAYYADPGENYRGEGYSFLYVIAAVIIISSCIPIAIFLYTLYIFKKKRPPYNSLENIEEQGITIQREIMGVVNELNAEVDTATTKTLATAENIIFRAEHLKKIVQKKLPES